MLSLEINNPPSRETIHFPGGLRSQSIKEGWVFGPIFKNNGLVGLGPFPDEQIEPLLTDLDARPFGSDTTLLDDPYLPTRIWRPFLGPHLEGNLPTETWASISYHANEAKDKEYATLARHVSICLGASNVRLRDLSDGYHTQLLSALHNKTPIGNIFENIPLRDIHLAIHSLVTEMGSARDYLAAIVGRQIGAPPKKTDSLARFIDWLGKAGRAHDDNPITVQFLQGWRDQNDPWLKQLTEYRNLFLHRSPMGARGLESAPRLAERDTTHGKLRTLEIPIPHRIESKKMVDALGLFIRLHWLTFNLAAEMARHSPYPSTRPSISSADLKPQG
jgi:hypothetical protein